MGMTRRSSRKLSRSSQASSSSVVAGGTVDDPEKAAAGTIRKEYTLWMTRRMDTRPESSATQEIAQWLAGNEIVG